MDGQSNDTSSKPSLFKTPRPLSGSGGNSSLDQKYCIRRVFISNRLLAGGEYIKESLNAASKFLASDGQSNDTSSKPSLFKTPRPLSGSGGNSNSNKSTVSGGSLFQTGSGRRVSISKESLNAASKFLASDGQSNDTSSKPSLFKTPRPLSGSGGNSNSNKSTVSGGSLFQTGSGRRVSISKESLNAASKLLSEKY